jgi:hypothetical protein
MFRQIIPLLLLMAFAVSTFNRYVIVLDYYTNTAAFADNCENKDLPEMDCHGKCQMMKKLNEEEKKEQQNPEQKADTKNELIARHYFAKCLFYRSSVPSFYYLHFDSSLSKGVYAGIFHPPAAV